jgi:histone acetyltransferase (RNA polymerase elongator complex component)
LHFNIPVFIPHLACPFTCVFCNQKHISGVQKPMEGSEIIAKIEQNLSTIDSSKADVEVGFFGGSFTCLEIEEQEKYLKLVQPYIQSGIVKSIRISTRPDYINDKELEFLKSMHVETIELGVQSMDDEVLKQSGRGHTSHDVVKASEMIKSFDIKLGLQMMIGLPGDTAEKSLQTAQQILDLKPDCVRIYPTLVVKNTRLEEMFANGSYKALAIEEAIAWTAPVLELFLRNKINVIRVGLHPSEEFESGDKLIAGPYHPSFRELVMTQIWHNVIKALNISEGREITISVPNAEYNNAIGYKAYNKNFLKQKYRRVRFFRNDLLQNLEFDVDYS